MLKSSKFVRPFFILSFYKYCTDLRLQFVQFNDYEKLFQRCNRLAPLDFILKLDGNEGGEVVSAEERRQEIMRILEARRQEKVANLAAEFDVSIRTIKYDIEALTTKYPVETVRGNGGCVRLAEGYRPHKNILSHEQQSVLIDLLEKADESQQKVLKEMLAAFGSYKKEAVCL